MSLFLVLSVLLEISTATKHRVVFAGFCLSNVPPYAAPEEELFNVIRGVWEELLMRSSKGAKYGCSIDCALFPLLTGDGQDFSDFFDSETGEAKDLYYFSLNFALSRLAAVGAIEHLNFPGVCTFDDVKKNIITGHLDDY